MIGGIKYVEIRLDESGFYSPKYFSMDLDNISSDLFL